MPSWRTPLRSPARLAVTAAAVLGIGFLAAHATGGVRSPRPTPVHAAPASTAPARPSPTAAPAPRTPDRARRPPHAARPVRFPNPQRRIAYRFAAGYVTRDLQAVQERATPALAAQLTPAVLRRVPATRVLGPPHPTVCTRDGCEIQVPTDGGLLVLRTTTAPRLAVAYLELG